MAYRDMDAGVDLTEQRDERRAGTDTTGPAPTAAPSGETGGSEAPPSDAGDEAPTPEFPVPPVPPPPAQSGGPIFGLAGVGGGGAASFARPGTAAAAPFRSQYFAANRMVGGPSAARFGAGAAVTAGGAAPFLPAGLGEDGNANQPGADDELQRIMALLQGRGTGGGM